MFWIRPIHLQRDLPLEISGHNYSKQIRNYIKEGGFILAGSILSAVSVCVTPPEVVPGNIIGAAMVCHRLFGTPIGLMTVLVNIPIMFFCMTFMGKKSLCYTIAAICGISFFTDLLQPVFPEMPLEKTFLFTIISSVLVGIAVGLLLRVGATTGGTTSIASILHYKKPRIPVGTALFLMDITIITVGIFALGKWEGILYSAIFTAVCSKVIDLIVEYKPVETKQERKE